MNIDFRIPKSRYFANHNSLFDIRNLLKVNFLKCTHQNEPDLTLA